MTNVSTATFAIGSVALTVHDLETVSTFYQKVVGLQLMTQDAATATLGDGETVLLELRRDRAARFRSPREAGLFHTAFLLPERADLGRWVRHASRTRAPVTGAADHGVSEALYLNDPEGNGIEIYADRPRTAWKHKNGLIEMRSDPLDLDDLAANAGPEEWRGFPLGSIVGHVHLQVGAIAPAESFYAGTLGLDITCRYPGGTFYAADGYHHHLATNIWNSRGAPARTGPSTGLANVEIVADHAKLAAVASRSPGEASAPARSHLSLEDPWGISITLSAQS